MNIERSAGPTEGISVRGVSKRFGATPVLREVELDVAPGRVVALLGPSGCGKTTLLRLVAGLDRADEGEIRVGDRILAGPGSWVAPERRRVGMVFQDWALFPHLTVAGNVGYGLPRRERRSGRVEETLELVGLAGLGDRMPGTLSGGQQQRVALARALAPRPSVLLLDEPFSNLDTSLRAAVRSEVHRLLVELAITTVFVTHDQEEAFVLGDEVAVMHKGRIVQQAPPGDLYARPTSPWVATFVGDANLLSGEACGRSVHTRIGAVPLVADATGPVDVMLRPEVLAVEEGDDGVVELLEFYGHDSMYFVRLDDGFGLRVRVAAEPRFRRGDRVRVRYAGGPTQAYGHPLGVRGGNVAATVPLARS